MNVYWNGKRRDLTPELADEMLDEIVQSIDQALDQKQREAYALGEHVRRIRRALEVNDVETLIELSAITERDATVLRYIRSLR